MYSIQGLPLAYQPSGPALTQSGCSSLLFPIRKCRGNVSPAVPSSLTQHCPPQLALTRPGLPPCHLFKTSFGQQPPGHPPQHHPPGCDKIQQPVCPDLFNATVRDSTYVGKVQLLVPTKVESVSLVVGQWGAGDRTKESGVYPRQGMVLLIWHLTTQTLNDGQCVSAPRDKNNPLRVLCSLVLGGVVPTGQNHIPTGHMAWQKEEELSSPGGN